MRGFRICLATLVIAALSLGVSGVAYALPTFEHVIDWNDLGPLDGAGYKQVYDEFVYAHAPTFDPPAEEIVSAVLAIRHRDNAFSAAELWYVTSGTTYFIGLLDPSTGVWTESQFLLSEYVLDEMMSSSPWTLQVRVAEGTTGTDELKLDYSKLSGEYTAAATTSTPEASTLILFGSGICAVAFLARKKGLIKF